MPLPAASEARLFYQSAYQRLVDARYLLDGERTTGATYLAGYAVECMLKALILSQLSPGKRARMLESFRGNKAHSYTWLAKRYYDSGGTPPPKPVMKQLSLVGTWTTDLRYQAGTVNLREAAAFLHAADRILEWADGRL